MARERNENPKKRWYELTPKSIDTARRRQNIVQLLEAMEDCIGIDADVLVYKLSFKTGMDIGTLRNYVKILVFFGETPFYIDENGKIAKNKGVK